MTNGSTTVKHRKTNTLFDNYGDNMQDNNKFGRRRSEMDVKQKSESITIKLSNLNKLPNIKST
jgi:hypothetical protein